MVSNREMRIKRIIRKNMEGRLFLGAELKVNLWLYCGDGGKIGLELNELELRNRKGRTLRMILVTVKFKF